ncbi:hypothetical protein MFRU_012g01340 [Monilinia fructicola]|uniref:Uncharacterized protein n=1 Tax=Monilinia fructicola TaxID=38448 RepID=A0A5M9JGB2_MONFR|nr:hypothetical protein EYC84_007605 [Monilinia fructicola]KAG4030398.1 hypothetical protein MFRU_012g01340 [Monilinia fructicola]
MSFFAFLQVIGNALVVAACVLLVSNPIQFDSPSPITESLPEPQATQLVAPSSTKKMGRVGELMGPAQSASTSPMVKRKTFTPHKMERRSTIDQQPSFQSPEAVAPSSSVAGAQHMETITSLVNTTIDIEMTDVASVYAEISEVISVEIEMTDAPIPELKSCFRSNDAPRSAKSVSFEGPSSDRIRGRLSTFEVDNLAPRFHEEYMATKQGPNMTFPLIIEFDDEGNATGWFSKRDSIYYPPTAQGAFVYN